MPGFSVCVPRLTTVSCDYCTAREWIWTGSPPAGWNRCRTLFKPVCAGSRLVCPADGIKASKEGKLMPAAKSLQAQSVGNSKLGWKPKFIMGHSLQAISLLIQGGLPGMRLQYPYYAQSQRCGLF